MGLRSLPSLSDEDMGILSALITKECGIKMPSTKRCLLESRLQKRLRVLRLNTFEEYCNYLLSDEGRSFELVHCIDLVTTNKTDFFREASHFRALEEQLLPSILRTSKRESRSFYRFWSAGCSTGEEPYTLAMVLSEFKDTHPQFDFSILASDVSTRVLDKARLGIYNENIVAPVPDALKVKYLLQSKDRRKDLVRVTPHLRSKITFKHLNFMDDQFHIREKMDVIFCRNVLIYFDRETQEKIINKFCQQLVPGGYLFLGHSETINGMNLPLDTVGTTIYRRHSA